MRKKELNSLVVIFSVFMTGTIISISSVFLNTITEKIITLIIGLVIVLIAIVITFYKGLSQKD